MSRPAHPFEVCSWCDLRAAIRHRIIVVDRRRARPRLDVLLACPIHRERAEREARENRRHHLRGRTRPKA